MIKHHFSSGLYAKETHIPANHWLVQHAHNFDHLSILAEGTVELLADGQSQVISAPACLTIPAGTHHGVRSLTDVVWYCLHATEYTDVDDIDEKLTKPINEIAVKALSEALNGGK